MPFKIRSTSQTAAFGYLQDAHEVRYWALMIDLFQEWRANTPARLSGDMVLHMLNSIRLDMLGATEILLQELEKVNNGDAEAIQPILRGVYARLDLLESTWDCQTASLESQELLSLSLTDPAKPCFRETIWREMKSCVMRVQYRKT